MNMDWNKYQAEALTTAIYPLERELDYTILGLCSEVAEVAELGITDNGLSAFEWYVQMKSELGDVAWYVAAVADALKVPLQEVADLSSSNIAGLHESRDAMLGMVSSAGYMAGLLKKAIRDDAGQVSDERKYALRVELNRILQLLGVLAESLDGVSLAGVLQDNLNKLSDRKQRGVLGGSGNVR